MNRYESNQNTRTMESLLPIETLLTLIQEQQETGYIHAYLSSIQIKRKTIKGMFIAQVEFERGQRRSCTIFTQGEEQMLLQGEEAWSILQRLRGVTWLITFLHRLDTSLSPPQGPIATQGKDPIPVRRVDPTQQQIALLDRLFSAAKHRRHRAVLLLVDGQRSSKEIGKLLSLDQKDVEHILRELAFHSFIYFNESKETK